MTPTDPAPRSRSGPSAFLALAVLALLAVAGIGLWTLTQRVQDLTERVAVLDRQSRSIADTVKLIRLEMPSEGRGVGAVLEQIGYWAPMLETASTPAPHVPVVEKRLEECLEAVGALGADAWPALLDALEASDNDEERKWLLRAARRADPQRGKELLVRVVRSTRLQPSARLRFFAADELLRIDKPLAGEVLRDVLQIESAVGITRQVPPALAPEYESYIGTNQFPQFFNFIDRFVASDHAEVANVLTMLIGREEHDLITYQQCIRALGKLEARGAVKRIKQLYENPPGRFLNPMFLNTCLQALAEIQGAEACPFFQEALEKTQVETVAAKLQTLIKDYCQ